ncbi:MAG TPA: aromatic amino acid hydroxylase [Polyangiaceae bacterium]|nr:aromatic amino acid hydroxylase [Polyangiaceae bacterium]
MASSAPHVPAHLRALVVEQAYEQYTSIDHAVWRFVLLQMRSRLAQTAHRAYRDGLDATGISVDRIPSIAQMNECLGRFGWAAVCVDGFIPPRAFQEFQASAILPIAADIRTRDHLVYTPAPDIIHEAAGHAPILPDPVFSAYLQRIGDLGRQAFTLPEEGAVFRAIHDLSEIKERPGASEDDVVRAEAALAAAIAGATEASEATRLSRLYWWTAEYGLVGRVDDYKIYGAGLLSSLGESESCHDAAVEKIALDERCMDVAYDITRPQPRLYVTPSFEVLHEVLDRAKRSLGVFLGGPAAVDRAIRSRETASVRFSSGAWVMGVVAGAAPGPDCTWVDLTGRVGFAWDGPPLQGASPDVLSDLCVLCGPLEGGCELDRVTDGEIAHWADAGRTTHRVRFASGATVEGRLARVVRRTDGRVAYIDWDDARIARPGCVPTALQRYRMIAAGDLVTARAGAVDPGYHSETVYSAVRVPTALTADPESARVLSLYESAERAHRSGQATVAATFPLIHAALERDYPREWLLRWNLLESLIKVGAAGELADSLRAELERLEIIYDRRQPIASGLQYLERIPRIAA